METIALPTVVILGILAINQPLLNNVLTVYVFYLIVLLLLPLYLLSSKGRAVSATLGLRYPASMSVAYILLFAASAGAGIYFVSNSSLVGGLFAFAVAPVCEEVFFRGYLLTALVRYGRWSAVILSALAFDVAHAAVTTSPESFVIRFAYGALFGLLYLNSGRILVPVAFHVIVNEYVVYGSVKPVALPTEAALLLTGVLLLGVAMTDYYRSTAVKARRPELDSGKGKG